MKSFICVCQVCIILRSNAPCQFRPITPCQHSDEKAEKNIFWNLCIYMLHFLALAIRLIIGKTDEDIIVAVACPDLGSDPPFWLSARMPRQGVTARITHIIDTAQCALIIKCKCGGHQCLKKVHPKVRNHGEGPYQGPYQGLLLVESGYYRFHI